MGRMKDKWMDRRDKICNPDTAARTVAAELIGLIYEDLADEGVDLDSLQSLLTQEISFRRTLAWCGLTTDSMSVYDMNTVWFKFDWAIVDNVAHILGFELRSGDLQIAESYVDSEVLFAC